MGVTLCLGDCGYEVGVTCGKEGLAATGVDCGIWKGVFEGAGVGVDVEGAFGTETDFADRGKLENTGNFGCRHQIATHRLR